MEQILDTPIQQENRPKEYAGFWIRVVAYFIDGIILGIAMWIFIFILGAIFVGTGSNSDLNPSMAIIGVLGFYAVIIIGFLLYFAIMESSDHQATLGKMAVGIRVGDARGNKISLANAVGRTAAKYLSGLILYIGFMMVGWDDRKQGLHDKLADTYVFYK